MASTPRTAVPTHIAPSEDLGDFLENSVEAIHSVGPDGTILWANRAELEMLGFRADEYVGRNIAEFHVDPEVVSDFLQRLLRGETLKNRYATLRCRDGSQKLALVSSSGLFHEGRFVSSRCFTRDITPARAAYEAQARLAAIVDSSDDAIVSKELDGTVMTWNAGAQRIFGYTADEMVGQSILRIVPPGLHDEERGILARIAAGQRIEHYRTQRIRKDGRLVDVSLTVSPLRDTRGVVTGASKIARDISGRNEAEEAKGVLAAIVQSSEDAIISKNLDGVITSWNPAAERMYGYTAAEMVGQQVRRIIPPELQDEEDHIVGEIRQGRPLEHYETVRLRKDGRRIEVSLTVSPVRDAGGTIIGASKIARDITEQREAQRRKDQFLAILAHELRNPLAPIRNSLALLRMATLAPDQRDRLLTMADRQMEHLTRLLDDLLDVSRLATGRVELKTEKVDFAAISRQAAETIRATLAARQHAFNVTVPHEPIWMEADPVRIAQVLNNLLTNAAKYTDPGGEVDFEVECEGGMAVARVSDNGIGFDAAMKERLFTLFAQDDGAMDRAAGGLGIGLALVREFVERHGGSVQARSEGRMRGSVFTVKFPTVSGCPSGS